jgi:transcriptional regulator with XRE-family HTH domain
MLSERLKKLRLAKGLSQDALVAALGGLVTKQAISKYERGTAKPTPLVLNKLAAALGTKAVFLWSAPKYEIEFIAYRKGSGLLKKDQSRIEATVAQDLEGRVRLQELLGNKDGSIIPVQEMRVRRLTDSEHAAETIRDRWGLGCDPLANVIAILEEQCVHVIEVDAAEKFDGVSAVARDSEKTVTAAAVASRRGVDGERQRLNLAHELGHLVLNVDAGVDEEKAAFRFGAALLSPADSVRKEVGEKRAAVDFEELFMLKRLFGMSIQALLYRLHDLNIVSDAYCNRTWPLLRQMGWKKREPEALEPEVPQWLKRNLFRAVSEGLLTKDEAETMLGEKLHTVESLSSIGRRSFMKLPLAERRRLLAEQAEKMTDHYESLVKKGVFNGGDYIEYEAKSKAR